MVELVNNGNTDLSAVQEEHVFVRSEAMDERRMSQHHTKRLLE